jgi:nucleotide-binding universal stress UspA family protein
MVPSACLCPEIGRIRRPRRNDSGADGRLVGLAQKAFVTNEKKLDSKHFAEELAKTLARHDIDVVLDKVDANGRRIGEVLESYAASHQVDVLVMGAYGHARWREFILGGATKSLLSKPPLPIMFSH